MAHNLTTQVTNNMNDVFFSTRSVLEKYKYWIHNATTKHYINKKKYVLYLNNNKENQSKMIVNDKSCNILLFINKKKKNKTNFIHLLVL